MRSLGAIPGFYFLNRWLTEYNSVQTQIGQRVGDLTTYYNTVGENIGEVRNAVGGGPEALDPNLDASGRRLEADEEDSGARFHQTAPRSDAAGPVDGLSQDYEDVFFDDGDV